ncbi:hypothetical protein FPSE_00604 [Fusarium pseudograminearum CS3096]|uniref:Uncharacterized protein n=1 Tax=Fusarium pseudograminearum (strain CS3096) TaxID=1028729 RepID=K3VWB5_FUSPC|nr:hypothetical protein FPSE_00604 [Fusarium pseudograminearum CS3096]EKJ79293.1 hypothetical protein FPSE_00604 [Fusarium pseudograminearum CS3096]
MPPINIEDDSQSHSTQPATNTSTTTRVVPHVVTEHLQTAPEWRINGHEAITSHDVEIISVTPTVQSPCVIMLCSGINFDGVPFNQMRFTERDVHLMSGPKLFGYWRGKGGRPWAAGISDDICHLLKILDEKDGKLEVQFVGCAKSKSEW